MKSITITIEEYERLIEISEKYKCLREHFEKGYELLKSPGEELGSDAAKRVAVKPKPKETKQQGVERFKNLIEAGQRAKKPAYLKKKK